jgi:hypothetical protein
VVCLCPFQLSPQLVKGILTARYVLVVARGEAEAFSVGKLLKVKLHLPDLVIVKVIGDPQVAVDQGFTAGFSVLGRPDRRRVRGARLRRSGRLGEAVHGATFPTGAAQLVLLE